MDCFLSLSLLPILQEDSRGEGGDMTEHPQRHFKTSPEHPLLYKIRGEFLRKDERGEATSGQLQIDKVMVTEKRTERVRISVCV